MTTQPNESEEAELENISEILQEAIDAVDDKQIVEIFDSISSLEALHQVSMMNSDDRDHIISILSPEAAAELIEEAPAGLAATMIESLDSTIAAKIMDELDADVQTDIVNEIDEEKAEEILSTMDSESVEDIRNLSQYEADSAGGLMDLDVFSFQTTDKVGTILKRFIDEDDHERYRGHHPYILDENGILVGVVSLRDLLRSKPNTLLKEIMNPVTSVKPDATQDDLIDLFDENPFLSIPVVNDDNLLLGIVLRVDLREAELERAEQQSLSRQQVGDELRSMPTFLRSRRRIIWLSSNILLNIIAASVISAYESTLSSVIALAIFLPMVSDMSGCSGNQAVGVSMRELALGLTRPSDLFHVLKKEFSVGIINGIILGIIIGAVAWVWKGNIYLGMVIGIALSVNTLLSVSIGGTIPLILKHLNIDPAVASGPILTTITDMAGFFFVLSLATLFMPMLI